MSKNYKRLRFLILFLAFLVILVNPFLNYYFQISFIQGWYQSLSIGKLWFVSPLEGFESILISKTIYLPLLIALLWPVLLASFLGRVFCSWICPISFLSELQERLLKVFKFKRKRDLIILPRRTIWFTLIGDVILAMILGAPIFVFLSPPGLVGREIMMAVFFHTLAIEGIVILLVLFMNFFTRRFFCRYFCPLGGMLAFLGSKRSLRIIRDKDSCKECRMCERVCPLGLSPLKDESKDVYCWNCGDCLDACRFKALRFHWKPNLPQD
ncbi:periplasmic nitrate reductase NapH [Thermodesulfatator indicus DSM 15286]|uniref:Periplasmic nitrate reductase NapH n=1 Tax=Thermodesulfatator indicus (strain DSM 15286 / JCM 11887 / CIR29812) TaxID=667014 RepID=F8AE23_THEID|nr:4Fe-4S binding protein [Thermodesulfatator indicus]AEH46069.1 periplasmic nitrate reductase NapH [Thermodesulfatator indicus DSM 15286]